MTPRLLFIEPRVRSARLRGRPARPPIAKILWLCSVAVIACDPGDPPGPRADADPASAATIVSLSAAATRFVVALGAGSALVDAPRAGDRESLPAEASGADLAAALERAPRWLFVPSQIESGAFAPPATGTGHETAIVEFAPHDLEDLFELTRTVGREIVGRERANAFEQRVSRPLSLVAAESDPSDRPRVAAVVSADPLRIAGGHSFASDLIEIAGGSSVTHGGEETALPADATSIRGLAPELVVVMLPDADAIALDDVRGELPSEIPSVVFAEDVSAFWSEPDPASVARALRRSLLAATGSSAAPGGPQR